MHAKFLHDHGIMQCLLLSRKNSVIRRNSLGAVCYIVKVYAERRDHLKFQVNYLDSNSSSLVFKGVNSLGRSLFMSAVFDLSIIINNQKFYSYLGKRKHEKLKETGTISTANMRGEF